MHLGIEYWEIWNEADLDPDDSTHKRTWGGTAKEYFALYEIAAKHLKKCFPHLKIGGPALAGNMPWAEEFMKSLSPQTPLDFFSWHRYGSTPEKIEKRMYEIDDLLKRYSRTAESICNEWNYVKGWTGEKWIYSLRQEKSIKGASFITAVMALSQKGPMDMLRYYDARPCVMNGMFNTDFVCDKLKGYYPFYMFHQLYKTEQWVHSEAHEHLYTIAAAKDGKGAVLFTYFSDEDESPAKTVNVKFNGFTGKKEVKVWQVDQNRDMELIFTDRMDAAAPEMSLEVPLFACILITIE